MKHGDILYKPGEKEIIDIKRQCFNKGPYDALTEDEQEIIDDIVDSETTYYIDPDWISLDNPEFIEAFKISLQRYKILKDDTNLQARFAKFCSRMAHSVRNLNVIKRLRKL